MSWKNLPPAVVILMGGCLTAPLPRIAHDAPGQYQLRVGEFAISADFPLARHDPLVKEVVEVRREVQETLRLPAGNDVIGIVLFENRQRYAEFLAHHFPDWPSRRAFFVKEPGGQLVVFACRDEHLAEDLRHEVTHALLHAVLPAIPVWLDEGLATYFEIHGDPKAEDRNQVRLNLDLAGRTPDLPRLEQIDDLWHMRAADYRESWLWVRYCLEHSEASRQALLEHLGALASGRKDSLADRLGSALEDPTAGVLDHLSRLPAEMAGKTTCDPEPRRCRPPVWTVPFEWARRLLGRED